MKNKPFETILYSTVGVLAMALLLIAFNVVAGATKQRMDLTREKAYTLSSGTRAILRSMLASRPAFRPPHIMAHGREIEAALRGYADCAGDLRSNGCPARIRAPSAMLPHISK